MGFIINVSRYVACWYAELQDQYWRVISVRLWMWVQGCGQLWVHQEESCWNVWTHTHNKSINYLEKLVLGTNWGYACLSVVLQDPREKQEENADWRSVGRFWRPMRRQHTSTDIINVLRKCFPGLVLCETLVWETTQRAVLINKFQHFDIWSLPSIFDHAGRLKSNRGHMFSRQSLC